MSDNKAPDPGKSAAKSMEAYVRYLPQLLEIQRAEMPQMEAAKLATQQQYSPQMAKLQADMYKQYGPQLARTSQQIDRQNKLAGAGADLEVLRGPGRQSVREVESMLRETDPEFFATREKTSARIGELLTGGLTPAEEEAISRKLARDRVNSGITVPTSTNTVAEAMQYGDAARNRTLQGVSAATSFLPASRTGFDPTQVALGRPSINTGDSKFMGVQQPQGVEGTANNFFNQMAGFQQSKMEIDANRRDVLDRVNESIGSINV